MGDTPLIVNADLGEFFRSEVTTARSELGIDLHDHTEYYLVNLLCDFSRPDAEVPMPGEEPLALLYKRALDADGPGRMRLLKNLGDVALYVSGFFAESIERSLVDIDYYISMGGNAYGSLSDICGSKRNGDTFAEVYMQLARKFTELVDMLSQIADRGMGNNAGAGDLLRLYDRWARTGSERVQKLLVEKGLIPTDDLSTEYIQ